MTIRQITAKHLTATALVVALVGFSLTACESSGESKSDSHEKGQKQTEQSFEQQAAAVPYPVDDLKDSQERRNLRERLLRQNEKDRIGYVYILSFGKFLGYYTIKGKVSSTQSQMTPGDILTGDMCGSGCSEHAILEAPGDDGSYGPNEPGVFFFTTEGAMVQISTDYIYSDQPIAVGDVPELNGSAQ